MKLGDLIKRYREEHGYSQRKMADLMKCSYAYVSMLEKGINPKNQREVSPSIDIFKRAAEAMGMDIETLIRTVDSNQPITLPASTPAGLTAVGELTPVPLNDIYRVPIIGAVRCGPGGLAIEYIDEYLAIDASYNPEEIRGFRAVGDSMIPDICPGDICLVRLQDNLSNGIFVVVVNDEEGMIKRVRYDEEKSIIVLESINPDYPPRVFVREESNSVRSVGKVVEVRHRY